MATRDRRTTKIALASASERISAATSRFDSQAHYESDLAYLEHELLWVSARVRRIAFTRMAGSSDSPDLPGDLPGEAERDFRDLAPRAAAEQGARWADAERKLRRDIDLRLEAHRTSGAPELGLDTLARCHGLSDLDRLVVLLAVGPCLSSEFEPLYGRLDGTRSFDGLTVERTMSFAEIPTADRVDARGRFAGGSPLVAAELIDIGVRTRGFKPKDLLGLEVVLTLPAFGMVIGQPNFEDELSSFSAVESPRARFDQVVLPEVDRLRIQAVVDHHSQWVEARKRWGLDRVVTYGRGAVLLFHGPPGTGKTLTAHAVADRLGLSVFNVDVPTFIDHNEATRFLPALFRAARHRRALLFFDECEMLFGDRRRGNQLMTLLLTELERFDGIAILATNLPDFLDEALGRRILVNVGFPSPDRAARESIWRKHLPPELPLAPDVDIAALADRLELSGGLIKNAVLVAAAAAIQRARGIEHAVVCHEDLETAARDHCRSAMAGGPAIPKVRLDDVVLPPPLAAMVLEMVQAARSRRTVLETWGLGGKEDRGLGIAALFHGEPGTGKTLCAEAVAGELCRPLMVASVPTLLSKWVGETEKNLAAAFTRARAHGAVLLLDECDSLLRARGEASSSHHDDNVVNVILGLLERHDGLVILVTNLPAALDPAVNRRLAYRLRFPAPDAIARAAIWRRHIPGTVPRDGEFDFQRLGERFAMNGALIKNAVLRAAFRAASRGVSLNQWLLEAAALEEQDTAMGGSTRGLSAGR
jgi:SpoVK/Ycf46/Vps4 family AAA+-type ATPase